MYSQSERQQMAKERDHAKRMERQDLLDKEWYDKMPCLCCNIAEVCKHRNVIKRPDYDKEVYDIKTTCKLKAIYCGRGGN